MGLVLVALALGSPPARGADPGSLELAWLAELGAEALTVGPRPPDSQEEFWVSVPGAVLGFRVDANGTPSKTARLPADFSSAYGLATSRESAVVASRQGEVALWRHPTAGRAPELVWRRTMDGRVTSVGWNGGDRVWVATRDGQLVALRSDDGERIWSVEIGGRAEAAPVATATDVYVATQSRALFRIDAETGTVRWKAALAGPVMHPPALTGGERPLVVCGTWNGILAAFEASSGGPVWSVELPAKLAASPVAAGDRVAVATEDGAVHVRDLRGRPVWSASGIADGPASLSFATTAGVGRLLVVSRRIAMLDLASGAPLDSYPEGAAGDLRRRFLEAMMEGEKTWTEAEKSAALEREAFEIAGPLFGPARHTGGGFAFGTEEGWVYLFDATTLRPTFRYRAGRPAAGLPRLFGDRLLVAAGDEVFALALRSGKLLWQRGVGGGVRDLAGGEPLAVLAGDRLSTLDAQDGSRGWTQRRGVRFVSAEREPWLLADAKGRLRVLSSAGRELAELPTRGTLLRPVPLSVDGWAAATEEGRLLRVRWRAGRLESVWQRDLGERIREVHAPGARLLVRFEGGALASLDPAGGLETWRLELSRSERVTFARDDHALIVYGDDTVRIYDLRMGRITFAREAPAEAVGVALDGPELVWLDRAGFAHTVDIRDGKTVRASDLGVRLEAAAEGGGGFLVRTAAGEIGVVVRPGRITVPASRDRQGPRETGGRP